ncbi:MAG: DUF1778 domain-containing protein [Waterburya sp.]
MTTNRAKKTARLEARITEEQKQMMEQAAYLRGQNLTEFVLGVLAEASMETIKNHALLELTQSDRAVFASALLDSNLPSEQARADAQWYRQMLNK